jgi:hypothetical protein
MYSKSKYDAKMISELNEVLEVMSSYYDIQIREYEEQGKKIPFKYSLTNF